MPCRKGSMHGPRQCIEHSPSALVVGQWALFPPSGCSAPLQHADPNPGWGPANLCLPAHAALHSSMQVHAISLHKPLAFHQINHALLQQFHHRQASGQTLQV